ncbi:MAG: alpha-amylase family glycosyl hydrolase [Acidimicrobiales bacterium]
MALPFAERALAHARPASLHRGLSLPRKQRYLPSPASWRDEVIYFLLVDRFSDGREQDRPLLDRHDRWAARPDLGPGQPWRWDRWAASGADRWQGGTLAGISSKLDYLAGLGVTAIWLSPVFKQRGHLDSYHGYGIQDFLDVDPRFGTRADLVALVAAAHDRGLRVVLDVIFNHSGTNWLYPSETPGGPFKPHYTPDRHPFGAWVDPAGHPTGTIAGGEDGVWPEEFQDSDRYTRAGAGSLGAGDLDDPNAEHKRTDFITLRDFRLQAPGLLSDLARCYKYWIALTGCDGFRIDTLKHVSFEEARNFCGSMKEFAANQGVHDFLLLAEIAGGDHAQTGYLDALERNLDAALDIGETRLALRGVAKGLDPPAAYFDNFVPRARVMGSHRVLGDRHVSVLDDHDHVFGEKLRFSSQAPTDHQVAAAAALQLFTLGIPCIYYGTEQALAGPEPPERQYLPEWGSSDRYLREAMFGPEHPRRSGRDGLAPGGLGVDAGLPGFGPFGTAGHHCFDPGHGTYRRMAAMAALRRAQPVLRHGRQYLRPISLFGGPFHSPGPGEVIAWSRILDDEEALCIVNGHGLEGRGAGVVVDAGLNPPGSSMTVVLSSAEAAGAPLGNAGNRSGASLPVHRRPDGTAYVEIGDLPPSEVLVLSNHPGPDIGAVRD